MSQSEIRLSIEIISLQVRVFVIDIHLSLDEEHRIAAFSAETALPFVEPRISSIRESLALHSSRLDAHSAQLEISRIEDRRSPFPSQRLQFIEAIINA